MAKKAVPASLQQKIIAAIQKQFGGESAMTLGGGECRSDVRVVIPTGVEVIDGHVLGIGGLPAGRIVELHSAEGAGKTTLALAAIAQVQAMGGVGVFIDMEHALDVDRARSLGVDVDAMIMSQPDTVEELLGHIETTLDALPDETPAVIVWDSLAAAMSQKEFDAGATGDSGRMLQVPAILSDRLRSIVPKLALRRAVLLIINQIRSAPGVTFGDPITTPGGNAVKFYASVRLRLLGGAKVREKGDAGAVIGKDIIVECIKNKLAPPFQKVRVRLLFEKGWDNAWSTLGLAKDLGVVPEGLRGKDAHRKALEALCGRERFGTLRKPTLAPAAPATGDQEPPVADAGEES